VSASKARRSPIPSHLFGYRAKPLPGHGFVFSLFIEEEPRSSSGSGVAQGFERGWNDQQNERKKEVRRFSSSSHAR
jgi:hypothetical protein